MGAWNYYFVTKLGLFFAGYIDLHRWENLIFAAILLVPIRHRGLWLMRLIVAIPVAIGLLHYDSRLPPITRLVSEWSALSAFSNDYLLELAGRFVNVRLLGTLFGLFLVVASLGLRLRISSFVLLGLVFAPLYQPTPGWFATVFAPTSPPDCAPASSPASAATAATPSEAPKSGAELDAALKDFYTRESERQVAFPTRSADATPFDIVFVHVCSLAWDDMRYVQDQHPLFQRFDVVFDHFNSAATYSGPASIRVLRATCGQTSETALYDPAPTQCYLFRNLTAAGYAPNVLLNHDGNYENFLKNLARLGGLDTAVLGNLGARVQMKAFYGSPIYDDYDILARWMKARTALPPGTPVALYYNTISLHDGNKVPGKESLSSLDTFKFRLDTLFDDLERFLADLETAARPTVVVLVPEHGAALRGEATQIAGMREIPSPAITRVPVGIKFIALPTGQAPAAQTLISKPTSYAALTALLADLMANNPYAGRPFDWKSRLDQLPTTDFIAENEKTVMIQIGGSYFLRAPDQSWTQYQAAP